MTTIAVIANAPLASALTAVARRTLGTMVVRLESFDVSFDADRDLALRQIETFLSGLDDNEDTLILTGLFGATPDNLTRDLAAGHPGRRVVTGVNLPMLLRACNYASRPLAELAEMAVDGGHRGITSDDG